MDTAMVQQFIDFFQDFMNLCQLENWPENETSPDEIKNAFLAAQNIVKCLDKLQSKNLLNQFLSVLNNNDEVSSALFKNCISDPPKYILKKIINSNTKINQMDNGFKVFLQVYNEEKLEQYLAEIMVESASKETLLKNLSFEFSQDKLLEFKSILLLTELNTCDDATDSLSGMLTNCNKEAVDLLVVSLLNPDIQYHKSLDIIFNAFKKVMLSKNHINKQFWTQLFRIEDRYLLPFCLKHSELFRIMATALIDSGKLHKEQMSAEFFYIDLSYSELVFTVQKLCKDPQVKLEFFDTILQNHADLNYFENMIS